MPHALIVDDEVHSLDTLSLLVEQEGFTVSKAGSLQEASDALSARRPDLVLSDIVLPDGQGTQLLSELQDEAAVEVILITGKASVETAVEALRMGAYDYLSKPVDVARLKTLLAGVLRTRELKSEVAALRGQLREAGRFGEMVGGSSAMQQVYDLIEKVAPTEATVFVTGESGTGKEMVAQTIHELSRRAKQPLLPLNCGAVSPNLIESELFGHERGSFTGADRRHLGHFERADGGTLFLDEITEMPIELQVKLLRVLETGSFLRVGGTRPIEVDVRVVAASNRDPRQAVNDAKLREDLYYRLKVFPIDLPPLRERSADTELLARHFLDQLNKKQDEPKRWTDEAIEKLEQYAWPGNVRELRNVVERAHILAEDRIDLSCLPSEVRLELELPSHRESVPVPIGSPLEEAERRIILATLDRYGSRKKTAETLGISLKTLYNRLKSYERAEQAG